MSAFERGQRLFMSSAGLATIVDFAARGSNGKPAPLQAPDDLPVFYVVKTEEVTACVPIDRADETLRPLVSPELAGQMLATVRSAQVPAPTSTRPVLERGKEVVHQGDPLEQAKLFRELCALPAPVSESIGIGLSFLARLVLGEICEVLAIERPTLEEELRQRYPAFSSAAQSGRIHFRE